MKKTLQAMNALDPQQKELLQTKLYKGRHTPRAAMTFLEPVADFDRMSDKARTPVGCTMAFLIFLCIPLLIITANGVVPKALGVLLLLAVVGAAIYFGTVLRKLMKADVSNNMRRVAIPFFAVIQEDMEPGERMDVQLDLSKPTHASKKTGKGEPYAKGAYHKIIDTFYRDPWFEGSAYLADGSVLSWSIVDEITESSCTKRNARGKYKTKTKYRKLSLMSVDVALPNKHYDVASLPTAEGEKLKLKEGEKRTTVSLTKKVKTKSNDPIDPREFFDLIAEAYRRAKPVAAGGAA